MAFGYKWTDSQILWPTRACQPPGWKGAGACTTVGFSMSGLSTHPEPAPLQNRQSVEMSFLAGSEHTVPPLEQLSSRGWQRPSCGDDLVWTTTGPVVIGVKGCRCGGSSRIGWPERRRLPEEAGVGQRVPAGPEGADRQVLVFLQGLIHMEREGTLSGLPSENR